MTLCKLISICKNVQIDTTLNKSFDIKNTPRPPAPGALHVTGAGSLKRRPKDSNREDNVGSR